MQQSQEEFLAASKAFFDWFKSQGGIIDTETIGLHIYEDSGRGAIALRDIEKGEVLFDIPRDLVLSTRTCTLQSELTTQEWTSLGKGWTTLILCMMWEESKGTEGKWAGYFGKPLNCPAMLVQ
ncbi:hypothetical protein FRC03_009411 [Tulasnella sp. 419]|nr:hypothetical protein FRC03_009411 [Tulasnella sp. 419]